MSENVLDSSANADTNHSRAPSPSPLVASYYGFMFAGGEDYVTKKISIGKDNTPYLDLWNNMSAVTDATELKTYNTYLFEQRAEQVGFDIRGL